MRLFGPAAKRTCTVYARGVYKIVEYVFDPAKDEVNKVKHGVSLALAELLFAGPHQIITDERFDYGEIRKVAFGKLTQRLFVCVFVDRADERRIISLRKANNKEVARHGGKVE